MSQIVVMTVDKYMKEDVVNKVAPCYHGTADYALLKQVGKNKWRVQCDYEDCPRSAHPTSGKTPEIALKKWNDRDKKYPTPQRIR